MLNDGTVISGAQVSQILTEELGTLKATIINNIRSTGQWASGKTAASMAVMVSGSIGELVGRRAFGTLETGRRGGRVPRNFAVIIYDWMQAKGIHADPMPYKTSRPHKYTEQERGDRTMAYFIARTIRREGTRLYRDGGRDDVYSRAIPTTIERINSRLSGIYAAAITQQIKLNTPQNN
jgi:hypothetical protein